MKKNNIRVKGLIILLAIVLFSFPISNLLPISNSNDSNNVGDIHPSAEVTNTTQWIKNPNFDSSVNWTSITGDLGDPTDVNGYIGDGMANYQVLGFEDQFTFEENYDMGASWVQTNHPDYPVDPTFGSIVAGEGFRAEHSWNDQNANQVPSVQWERNFSLPVNMSDYIITSASVLAGVNATVDSNIDTVGDGVAVNTARIGYDIDTYSVGDYIRFYVSISNLQKTKTHEIAHTQSTTLGDGDAGGTDNLAQQLMSNVSQADLIYYISSVLETDYINFTLIVGIRFNCEDNVREFYDLDDFDRAVINSINLTFAYEKKIDQLTSISWKQVGDIPSNISYNPIVIDEAILNFQYKINDTWPSSSPNSEIRIIINEGHHSETIKLSSANGSFQDAKAGGFDVTYLIDEDKNVNLSIQVYLADNFELDRIIAVSIDDVYLNITYTETVPDLQTKYQLFLNDVNKTDDLFIEQPLGVNLNITVKYITELGVHIPGATVQIEGKVNDFLSEDSTQYYIIVNTTQLGIGTSFLKIKAQKTLYESQEFSFLVKVTERDTEIELFLNNNPKSESETLSVQEGDTINVTVYYKDLLTGNPLNNATVTLLGVGELDEMNNYYYTIVNSSDLVLGINAFTIFAQLINYTPQSIHFFIEVYEKSTNWQLFLNGVNSTSNPYINLEIFEPLNITVKYMNNESVHILDATLQLIGEGLMLNFTENEVLQQYNCTIDTVQLGLGVKLLNIIAQKSKHETQNIQLFVEVTARNTTIELFLDGDPKNDGDKINVEIDDIINVTVFFRDFETGNHLPNATVELLEWGMLNETNNQYYNFTIQATDLDQGITILTIFADKNYYEPQTIQFFIEVVERDTELELFLNGEPKNDGEMIKVEVDDTINITVYFRDGKYGTHIQNATVQLIGWIPPNLNETNNQYYNITINANDLEQGITILTIFAEKYNYQPQTIRFFIEVTERMSQLQLFLDDFDKTNDPIYDLAIKEFLNITVKYTDNQTGFHITNATIQLVGEGLSFNLTEDTVLGQYYILLDTTNLGIGIKLFTIIAHAPNYIIKTIGIRITVTRISGTISREDGGAQIEAEVGEDVLLNIILRDHLNNTITNANVTYMWAYGQGELEDLDNDGIYNVTFLNVPLGVHTITIYAFAGDDYSFETYIITLVVTRSAVSPGPNLSWLISLLVYGFIGVILVVGTIFTLYIKRWRFPPLVRKIRALRKKVSKVKKTKPVMVNKREEIIKNNLQDSMKILSLELIQPEKIDKIEKINLEKEEVN